MVTRQRLQEVLHFDPATGVFTQRLGGKGRSVGAVAGTISGNGRGVRRIRIFVDYKGYQAHRLAWLYVHGCWPAGDIDHIDGNPLNNAIANLRDVSRSVNMENQRRARADSKVGLLGVSERDGKFRAEIKARGRRRGLGTFPTADAAHAVYLAAKRQLHIGCTI